MSRILIVDDEPAIRRALTRILHHHGHECRDAEDGVVAVEMVTAEAFDVVLTDLIMPRADGYAVLKGVRAVRPGTPVIMLTANGSIAECVTAMRAGAADFLTKPFNEAELISVIESAAAPRKEEMEITRRGQAQGLLIGESPKLRAVLDTVERIARSETGVLITGESGTGKEVVARLLHGLSPRAGRPFVAVNCGAIPEGLVESELFGHARGAFTGATDKRAGKFVLADRGTLFLDEVGELPLAAQVKLLRVLQDREINPVGESKPVRIDVRIVAATNRDLEAMVGTGRFREDLYFRLNVVPIELPPLRARPEDVRRLAEHFLSAAGDRAGRRLRFAERTIAIMEGWTWPGNVRELENLVERLVVLSAGDEIPPELLPPKMLGGVKPRTKSKPPMSVQPREGVSLQKSLSDAEDLAIADALAKTNGNKAKAAKLLGMKRTTLVEKLRRRRQT